MLRSDPRRGVLAELLTLWAALVGLVAVAAVVLFAELPEAVTSAHTLLMLLVFSLGCTSLALTARIFIRRWNRAKSAQADYALSRHAAVASFVATPALMLGAYILPGSLSWTAHSIGLIGCVAYGVGCCLVVWHGAHSRAPVHVRAFYWAALPLVLAFLLLMSCLGSLGLLL